MVTGSGNLTIDELGTRIDAGEIDTVIVAFADMQGRLVGKRASARLFREEIAAHGAEACNYLLAVDVEMNTVDGYAISSWQTGYGDMVLKPDLDTLRLVPWAGGIGPRDGGPVPHGRRAGVAEPPRDPEDPDRPSRRPRPRALRRHRAGVPRLRRHLP